MAGGQTKEIKDNGETEQAEAPERRGLHYDSQLARALRHPTRVRILAVLNDRVASPKELEGILGLPMTHISYHCRELLRFGCVEVAKTEQVRGAVKTSYRATTRMVLDTEQWTELEPSARHAISLAAVGEVVERASTAIEAETFDKRLDRCVVTVKLDADEQAWDEITEIIEGAYRQIAEVDTAAAGRDTEKFRTTISLLSYESPEERA
jgi:DNA-binding transcriptional ArsR family regulator